jgi:hypothetical protein
MNEGTRSVKSTIRLLGISAERPTNGLYLYLTSRFNYITFTRKQQATFTNPAWTIIGMAEIHTDLYIKTSLDIPSPSFGLQLY